MRHRLGLPAVLCALSLLATGCLDTAGGGASGGEILIGVTLEETGAASVLGRAEATALKLVAEDVNKEGVLGKKIKLVMRDNQSNPAVAARQVNELIANDKVVGLIGAGTTETTLPFLDAVENSKVPTVSMGASDAITTPFSKRRYVFKTPQSGIAAVQVMLQEFAARGIKRIATLTPDNAYGETGVRAFAFAAQKGGLTILGGERYKENQKDYTPQVASLVAPQPAGDPGRRHHAGRRDHREEHQGDRLPGPGLLRRRSGLRPVREGRGQARREHVHDHVLDRRR
jgi:branched-chain amino acid transport system substrate-binding protein